MRRLRAKKPAKVTVRQLLIIIGVPLVAACLTFMFLHIFALASYDFIEPVKETGIVPTTPNVTKLTTVAIEPPVRLEITRIKIDATIYETGLTSTGDMDISENPDEVAWYRLGPKPGEIGSAVIAGHYGWKNDHGSIFNNLHVLVKGDEISVYDATGIKKTFVVQATQIYNPDADAKKVFISTDRKAHLNLITCGGTWVDAKNSYTNRLVVFTDLK